MVGEDVDRCAPGPRRSTVPAPVWGRRSGGADGPCRVDGTATENVSSNAPVGPFVAHPAPLVRDRMEGPGVPAGKHLDCRPVGRNSTPGRRATDRGPVTQRRSSRTSKRGGRSRASPDAQCSALRSSEKPADRNADTSSVVVWRLDGTVTSSPPIANRAPAPAC